MARRRKRSQPAAPPADEHGQPRTPPPEPVDVIDGIPDRNPRPAWWKIALLALIFLLWVAFLVYCRIAGAP